MYKAVIFDLDGTLLNTLEDLANSCNYALEQYGYKVHELEKYKRFLGDGRLKLIERILPEEYRNPEIIEKVLTIYDEHYKVHMDDITRPYDGILEVLDILRENEMKLAVVSNKPHEFATEVVLKYFGDRFDVVFGHRENFKTKPDPETVLEAIKKLGVKKEECIFVGDSDIDIKTAKNANLKSIGVLWGFRSKEELEAEGADYLVSNVGEILKIFEV